MSRQIIAIDIRHTCLSAVLLSTGLKSNIIEGCAHVALCAQEDGADPLAAALDDLRRRLDFGKAEVVIGLPADQTIYRTVTVPFKEEKKIRQVLPFELEPHLPMGVENLVIDYHKGLESEITELLTVAIDRQNLDTTMALLADAQIQPQLVLPGDFALALEMAAHDQGLPEHALMLNAGAQRTTLFAFVSRKIALVRCLTSDTASDAGVEVLALKIRQTLTAFADRQPGGFAPTMLYLSGPALSDATVAARLSDAMEIPAQTVDLRTMIAKLELADTAQWQPCAMNSALAMALVEAQGRSCPNFYRTGSLFRNYWTTYRPYVRAPAILLAIVLLLGMGGIMLENHILQQRLNRINAQTEAVFAETFPGTRRVGDPLSQMKSELRRAQGGSIDAGQAIPQVRTVDILLQLSEMIPMDAEVLFTRLVLGGDGLTVAGETAGFNIVDDIKNRLEQSDLFKQVTIASANMDRSGNKVRFSLKLEL